MTAFNPVANQASEFEKLLAWQENQLTPDYRTRLFSSPASCTRIVIRFWETAHLPLPQANILPKVRSKC